MQATSDISGVIMNKQESGGNDINLNTPNMKLQLAKVKKTDRKLYLTLTLFTVRVIRMVQQNQLFRSAGQ